MNKDLLVNYSIDTNCNPYHPERSLDFLRGLKSQTKSASVVVPHHCDQDDASERLTPKFDFIMNLVHN